MCGIAGFVDFKNFVCSSTKEMTSKISHRGPDDLGEFISENDKVRIGLGHRRLSILDLSKNGHQPMTSHDGRFVIILNGEIYNHRELRSKLQFKGINWRGHSDTETLLAAFDEFGVAKTLKLAVGMFAIAIWDKIDGKLILARDRMGEKPLYFGWKGNSFLFASELKALEGHPAFEKKISKEALSLYFKFGYVPTPHSIYENIKKLKPGSFLELTLDETRAISKTIYWSFKESLVEGIEKPINDSDKVVLNNFKDLLGVAVKSQMQSDVPLGAFLSGGIDSSLISGVLQEQSSSPINTFTIGFEEKQFNEAEFANDISKHLGTNHTELYVSGSDSLNVIPYLPEIYDEPFGDQSAIPTFIVSKMAKTKVTVALSGDAGDELYGGYSHYLRDAAIWNKVGSFPKGLKNMASPIFSSLAKVNEEASETSFSNKLKNISRLMSYANFEEFFLDRRTIWKWNDSPFNKDVLAQVETKSVFSTSFDPKIDVQRAMMEIDSQTYLPDDILAKVDRAAMAVSLETRVPLLDYRLVEFSNKLPLKFKIRGNETKWILRHTLYNYVPQSLMERPKMGFSIPLAEWLRGPLKSWMEDLMHSSFFLNSGLFDVEMLEKVKQEHLSKKFDHGSKLWVLLVFLAWQSKSQAHI